MSRVRCLVNKCKHNTATCCLNSCSPLLFIYLIIFCYALGVILNILVIVYIGFTPTVLVILSTLDTLVILLLILPCLIGFDLDRDFSTFQTFLESTRDELYPLMLAEQVQGTKQASVICQVIVDYSLYTESDVPSRTYTKTYTN